MMQRKTKYVFELNIFLSESRFSEASGEASTEVMGRCQTSLRWLRTFINIKQDKNIYFFSSWHFEAGQKKFKGNVFITLV